MTQFNKDKHKWGWAYKVEGLDQPVYVTYSCFGRLNGYFEGKSSGVILSNWDQEKFTRSPENDLIPRAEVDKLAVALRGMMEEKIDYMVINDLGDPDAQYTILKAKQVLAAYEESK